MYFNPFRNNPLFLRVENTLGKGEIARNEISPFSTLSENSPPLLSNSELSSAKSLMLEESKNC